MNDHFFELENGIKVVTKEIPNANSIAMGIYSLSGLIQEPKSCNGIAHFLEHMSFKGTKKRSAKKITEQIDYMGGIINAHTTKEYTSYFLAVQPHFFTKGLDVLCDIYFNSKLNQSDIDMERQVILEEINLYEDTPDELIHDLFSSTLWSESKLGLPILGTEKSLQKIDKAKIEQFKLNYLNPKNIIISIAGKIPTKAKIGKQLSKYCGFKPATNKPFDQYTEAPGPSGCVNILNRNTEQIHFCFGGQGVEFDSKDHYTLVLLSTALGGSMSSRLFQKIREKRGWAYSIYAYASSYKNAGLFSIYGGINKKKFKQTLNLIIKEMDMIKASSISKRELRKIKEQLKGNMMLGLEKPTSWMSWLARSMIYFKKIKTIEEVIEEIESVDRDSIQKLAQTLFQYKKMAITGIGPILDPQKEVEAPILIDDYLDQLKIKYET